MINANEVNQTNGVNPSNPTPKPPPNQADYDLTDPDQALEFGKRMLAWTNSVHAARIEEIEAKAKEAAKEYQARYKATGDIVYSVFSPVLRAAQERLKSAGYDLETFLMAATKNEHKGSRSVFGRTKIEIGGRKYRLVLSDVTDAGESETDEE